MSVAAKVPMPTAVSICAAASRDSCVGEARHLDADDDSPTVERNVQIQAKSDAMRSTWDARAREVSRVVHLAGGASNSDVMKRCAGEVATADRTVLPAHEALSLAQLGLDRHDLISFNAARGSGLAAREAKACLVSGLMYGRFDTPTICAEDRDIDAGARIGANDGVNVSLLTATEAEDAEATGMATGLPEIGALLANEADPIADLERRIFEASESIEKLLSEISKSSLLGDGCQDAARPEHDPSEVCTDAAPEAPPLPQELALLVATAERPTIEGGGKECLPPASDAPTGAAGPVNVDSSPERALHEEAVRLAPIPNAGDRQASRMRPLPPALAKLSNLQRAGRWSERSVRGFAAGFAAACVCGAVLYGVNSGLLAGVL